MQTYDVFVYTYNIIVFAMVLLYVYRVKDSFYRSARRTVIVGIRVCKRTRSLHQLAIVKTYKV